MARHGHRIRAKIFASQEKCMEGSELRRLRQAAGLSQEQLARQMNGWGWYRLRVARLEDRGYFCLSSREMQALLDVLGARAV